MKKLFLVTSFILALGATLMAQDCATGYCPDKITVHHKAGSVSPQTVDITYEVIKVKTTATPTYKCMINRNLGATTAPSAVTTTSYTSNGWYWQYNRKQGYYIGSTSTFALQPTTTAGGWNASISEVSDWLPGNDPCTLLLGATWRIPTVAEYTNIINGGFFSWLFANVGPTSSSKILFNDAGEIDRSGTFMNMTLGSGRYRYWCNDAQGYAVYGSMAYSDGPSATPTIMANTDYKSNAASIRCLRTY